MSEFQPLSIDDAVAALSAAPETEEDAPAPETAADDTQSEADQTADDEAGPDEATGDDEEADEGTDEAIPPPPFWDADAKERWAKLDPATQAYVLEREKARDSATNRVVQEAAITRRTYEAEAGKVSAFIAHLESLSQRVEQAFADQWSTVDWPSLAQTDPAEYVRLRAAYEADLSDRQALQASQRQAQEVARVQQVQEEARRLREIAPELASDPKEVGAVGAYLVEQGIDASALADISATELTIAHKAMLYDRLKARGFKPAAPSESTPAKSVPKAVKPSAGGTREPPQSQRRQALMSKRSLTVDEALALI